MDWLSQDMYALQYELMAERQKLEEAQERKANIEREKKATKVEQHLIKELKALYAEIKVENEKEAIKVEKSESGSVSEWECASESGRSSEWEAVS